LWHSRLLLRHGLSLHHGSHHHRRHRQAVRRAHRAAAAVAARARRRVLHPAGPQRLRQDHLAALHRRVLRARRRAPAVRP
jgi:hypothetical protein